ncbi:hypothetical protein [Sphingomonas glaciei]|uniref:Uncharacterized protein n=1 Tax=Sphingomonas glaciei TaxID=2938948 RepID=A0ABY5MSL4_9SPHN|nr:hypothetical protein [Sphingomonas glaciei]UUR07495.1 hypothetical protein M1K48_11175 [Sphingomonas glaciei]
MNRVVIARSAQPAAPRPAARPTRSARVAATITLSGRRAALFT